MFVLPRGAREDRHAAQVVGQAAGLNVQQQPRRQHVTGPQMPYTTAGDGRQHLDGRWPIGAADPPGRRPRLDEETAPRRCRRGKRQATSAMMLGDHGAVDERPARRNWSLTGFPGRREVREAGGRSAGSRAAMATTTTSTHRDEHHGRDPG